MQILSILGGVWGGGGRLFTTYFFGYLSPLSPCSLVLLPVPLPKAPSCHEGPGHNWPSPADLVVVEELLW